MESSLQLETRSRWSYGGLSKSNIHTLGSPSRRHLVIEVTSTSKDEEPAKIESAKPNLRIDHFVAEILEACPSIARFMRLASRLMKPSKSFHENCLRRHSIRAKTRTPGRVNDVADSSPFSQHELVGVMAQCGTVIWTVVCDC